MISHKYHIYSITKETQELKRIHNPSSFNQSFPYNIHNNKSNVNQEVTVRIKLNMKLICSENRNKVIVIIKELYFPSFYSLSYVNLQPCFLLMTDE